jgi:cell division protein FtsN
MFTVQVGAFGSRVNADNLVKKLMSYSGVSISPAATESGQTLYRVRVGPYGSREEAVAFADKLNRETGMAAKVLLIDK